MNSLKDNGEESFDIFDYVKNKEKITPKEIEDIFLIIIKIIKTRFSNKRILLEANETFYTLTDKSFGGIINSLKTINIEGEGSRQILYQIFKGDKFNHFLQSIEQEVIVMFEEFDTVYIKFEEQAELLTVLDGVFKSKKLFIFTTNNAKKIHDSFWNRPGRIYYAWEYRGLSEVEIKEYCNDHKVYNIYISSILDIAKVIENFNFDMLQTIIEEIKRYNITPKDTLERLNIKLVDNNQSKEKFKVILKLKNDDKYNTLCTESIIGNPMSHDSIHIDYIGLDDKYRILSFRLSNLIKYDFLSGFYNYSDIEGNSITLIKELSTERSLYQMF